MFQNLHFCPSPAPTLVSFHSPVACFHPFSLAAWQGPTIVVSFIQISPGGMKNQFESGGKGKKGSK